MKRLSFKVSEDEARLIRIRAKREQVSVSEYLRRRASGLASKRPTLRLIRCPKTGAMIFAPLDGESSLTTETVRELLTDFP
jgi:hypothetical protein